MQTGHDFPASAASSLVAGYCDDFIQLAATLAQALEQVSMRDLPLGDSRKSLERVEHGMRALADAIRALLDKQDEPKLAAAGSVAGANALAVTQTATRAAEVAQRRPLPPAARTAAGAAASPATSPATSSAATATRPSKSVGSEVFQGSTETMPVRSVLQFLMRMRKTGTLWLAMGGERMTIDLADGCVTGTTSDNPPTAERVGELLVEYGFLQADQLKPFLAKAAGPVPIGAQLVRAGLISEGQLLEILEVQVRRRFERAVQCKHATYSFHEGPRAKRDGRIRIRPIELMGRGGQR